MDEENEYGLIVHISPQSIVLYMSGPEFDWIQIRSYLEFIKKKWFWSNTKFPWFFNEYTFLQSFIDNKTHFN